VVLVAKKFSPLPVAAEELGGGIPCAQVSL